ncbi:MAG: HDIG domain-containing protein, partial [Deltaproteobacteria bacterium]|nr:HDIG domain-containing protein [Deltaproteobacteria bacterium]
VLASLLVVAALSKANLLLTPLSVFLIPAGALPLLVGALVDKNAGLGCAIAFSLVVSSLSPFDAPVAIVLSAQGIGALLAFTRAKHKRSFFVSALASALAASGAYVATTFLYAQDLSLVELKDPIHSALLASAAGGLLAGPVALFLRPSVERLLGEVPRSRLIEHADLESPLLKQIAARAPGTWQHSLAMANMAEITANAIGANALLVRVGAYYHDLGKSLNSQFYIENLEPGQQSPHDQIPPEASAEAIYRHVTEGIRVARERGLPEAIVDFMLMHHGDGILEYFWSKCQEQGNPRKLTIDTFRYPGVRPQTRETAILAICDAVEAASRSLKQPNARAILALVQRIVYGKLHLGQLDDSGLTMAELRTIANTLVEILKHAHHVRIEYPWQREEAAVHQGATQAMGAGAPTAAPDTGDVGADASAPATTMAVSASQGITMSGRPPKGRVESTVRFLTEHVLDSADAPRPFWDNGREGRDGRAAPELPVDSGVAQSLSFEAEKSAPTVAPAIPSHSMPPPRRRT